MASFVFRGGIGTGLAITSAGMLNIIEISCSRSDNNKTTNLSKEWLLKRSENPNRHG
jgi:hypothetical protein